MVVIVTRDAADRTRGFLASCLLEIAPGVYVGPRMNPSVRERVWAVLCEWQPLTGGSVVMTWNDHRAIGGLGLAVLGTPPVTLVDLDGVFLLHKSLKSSRLEPKSPESTVV